VVNRKRTGQEAIPLKALVPFLLLTFAIAWGILAAFIFLPETMAGLFGEITGQHPLFYLAVWAPAISAFIIIFRLAGLEGMRGHLGHLLIWRCSWVWYAFLLFGVPWYLWQDPF